MGSSANRGIEAEFRKDLDSIRAVAGEATQGLGQAQQFAGMGRASDSVVWLARAGEGLEKVVGSSMPRSLVNVSVFPASGRTAREEVLQILRTKVLPAQEEVAKEMLAQPEVCLGITGEDLETANEAIRKHNELCVNMEDAFRKRMRDPLTSSDFTADSVGAN